jgi:hypothetical protein
MEHLIEKILQFELTALEKVLSIATLALAGLVWYFIRRALKDIFRLQELVRLHQSTATGLQQIQEILGRIERAFVKHTSTSEAESSSLAKEVQDMRAIVRGCLARRSPDSQQ